MKNITGEPMLLFNALIKQKADVSLTAPALCGILQETKLPSNCKNCGAPLKEKQCDHCNTRYL